MTINEMKDYISKSMEASRKTENESNKKQAVKYREFLSRVLEIIHERDKMQNRCFALSGFGTLCSFCPYECDARHTFDNLKEGE